MRGSPAGRRRAGAIILAKTNMAEFAWHGTYTLSSERGRTNNPYNQANSASGSSGGTGAAVAAGYAPAGLGTDPCGSIVGPSAHQSLVGYRPTMRQTSVTGIVPLSPRQDVSGPMTTTVTDAALLMEVLAGYRTAGGVGGVPPAPLPRGPAEQSFCGAACQGDGPC
nr:amidase family protein [Rathayibacter sp. VKM Ac-2760]